MLSRKTMRGVTLIELVVTLVIFFILTYLALPNFSGTVQDRQIRATAESILSGLQLARSNAVSQNLSVQFNLPGTQNGNAVAGGADWAINIDSTPFNGVPTFNVAPPFQTANGSEGSTQTLIGAQSGANFSANAAAVGANLPLNIVFNSQGRTTSPALITQIDVVSSLPNAANARRLSIIITLAGQIRLCDPQLQLANSPQGCV